MKTTKQKENCNRKNVNVYSYARWSSDQQTEGDGLRRQEQPALDWCARNGLTLAGCEVASAVSAKAGKNRAAGSGLDRLLKRVQPGDCLLVEDNNRLSRQDRLVAMNFLDSVVDKGVTVVTLSNPPGLDHEGAAVRSVFAGTRGVKGSAMGSLEWRDPLSKIEIVSEDWLKQMHPRNWEQVCAEPITA